MTPNKLSSCVLFKTLFTLALLLVSANAQAQVRIQGITTVPAQIEEPLVDNVVIIDYREKMRQFVQSISEYGRRIKPNFIIIAKDGLDLLMRRDISDDTKKTPARTYMRAIDGVMQEGLFFADAHGDRPFGAPPPIEIQTEMLSLADHAKKNGLKVLVLDFGKGNKVVDEARKLSNKRGFLSLLSDVSSADISKLPTYPSRPPNENPKSILSLSMIQNYATIRNSASYGLQSQFALKMHDTNYDALLVDVFHGRTPLSRQAVETLKYKKIGARRMVLAYMNIGHATSYYYYWNKNWATSPPGWLSEPVLSDPDHYNVKFWQQGWQDIVSGGPNSYLYGIISQGFDGVVIDGVNAYNFYESDGYN